MLLSLSFGLEADSQAPSQAQTADLKAQVAQTPRLHSVVVDERGVIYVADRENGRIQRFDLEGEVTAWTPATTAICCLVRALIRRRRSTARADRIRRMYPFAGIYTPLATPFSSDGSLDERGLEANVQKYLQSPLTGLVVLGSNGEAPQLDDDEADRAIAVVRSVMPKDRPLLAGTGRESTAATIAATERAARLGADAVLVRTPAFYKGQMTTDAFVRHYTQVADRSPVPVLLYNVTIYTGVNLLPDAVAILSQHPNIVGIKETNTDMVQFADYLSRAKDGFTVLAGAASTYYSALALGAHGAILAVGGVAPELCTTIFELASDGRFDEARRWQRKLSALARLVGTTYGVPGLKAALDLIGFAGGAPRPPLQPVGDVAIAQIREQLNALNLLEAAPASR